MDSLFQNIRFAVRSLRKSPALTASVVLTLALCIGATTAIFSVVYAVLFRPLPFAKPGEILLVRTTWKELTSSFSVGNWADVKRQQSSFRYFVPAHGESFNLAGADAPENVDGARSVPTTSPCSVCNPRWAEASSPRRARRGGPAWSC